MKKLIATVLLLGLLGLAASAFALPITFDVVGTKNSTLRATVTASFDPSTLLASIMIQNTTGTKGTITGFAFNLPGDGLGVSSVTDKSGFANWHLLNPTTFRPNTINTPQPLGSYDVGLGTGPNFGGGKVGSGIAMGESKTFSLLFSGNGAGGLSTSAIMAALSQPKANDLSQHFAVRFQETTGGQSDVATPAATPVPGAVWLLGSGLLGVLGFKRSRKAS